MDSEARDTTGAIIIRRLEKIDSNKPNQSQASDTALKETWRNFIPKVCVCPGAPLSPPLHLHSFSFILLIHAEAAPRPARTAARCPGGGARCAARPGGRRAGPRSASGSGVRSPRPVRCSAWSQEPLSAQPGARRPAPRLRGFSRARAEQGPAAPQAGEGSQGRGISAEDSLGWGVIFAPWKVRACRQRPRNECLAGFESRVARGDPTSSANYGVGSSARGPAPGLQPLHSTKRF